MYIMIIIITHQNLHTYMYIHVPNTENEKYKTIVILCAYYFIFVRWIKLINSYLQQL